MKLSILVFTIAVISSVSAQDTFSIVAVDSTTGEVGSAGASCVDLFNTPLSNDDFLGVLVPGVGAINTQAYYIPANQDNATNRMNLGDTPDEIIQWVVQNDIQGNPNIRQYGVAAMVNGSPQAAAHTGISTDDYKNHIVGSHYAIQGNILLGQEVLDSMEARFLAEDGDLACKLMAALQGANMVGADTRCTSNGTSSLFAFVKVAQPTDTFGSPSFLVSVRTHNNDGIEPIDSLQTLFDQTHWCTPVSLEELHDSNLYIHPNPAQDQLNIGSSGGNFGFYSIIQPDGKVVLSGETQNGVLNISSLSAGAYIIRLDNDSGTYSNMLIKK